MFTRKHWHLLIVDDEPDIHEVTTLTLKKEEFYGARLKLHHANSAKEAIELLQSDPALMRSLAVALVDVVMETDHAGLDFCRFVRNELKRQSVQLILRTGQPGQAPPRKIIDELSLSNSCHPCRANRVGDAEHLRQFGPDHVAVHPPSTAIT